MLGLGARIRFAFRCFFSILFQGRVAADILDAFRPTVVSTPAAPAAPDEDRGDRAVQLLAILQRDGRLVDFLQEDLTPYTDTQIGAGVRDVHASSRAAFQRYFTLEPVVTEAEGERMAVTSADPARIKVVGAVGSRDAHGVIRHRGWRVTHIGLPPLPPAAGRDIVAPAEIEVQ